MKANMKERMAQHRMHQKMKGAEEEWEMESEMPIEGTLSSMNAEMVDHMDNAQMRTLLKQAIEYFQADKD